MVRSGNLLGWASQGRSGEGKPSAWQPVRGAGGLLKCSRPERRSTLCKGIAANGDDCNISGRGDATVPVFAGTA